MKHRVEYETIRAKTVLNPVKAPSMPFDWSINPYRGCQHGCSFCYARSTHVFLGEAANDRFQNHIYVKANAPEALRAQLQKLTRSRSWNPARGYVAIGTATDPYQPVEASARLTRGCLEVLAEYRVPTSITTRSPLILRDLDLLRKIPVTSINLSINTLDKTVWRQFEPYTPSPDKRLETVRALAEAGIPAGIFLAPILPGLTDGAAELTAVIESAARHKAQYVMSSVLRLSTPEVKLWFFRTLERHYPHLTEWYAGLYHRSAYVPSSYKEPVMKTIRSLLQRFGLPDIESFRREEQVMTQPADPGPAEPVQLCLF